MPPQHFDDSQGGRYAHVAPPVTQTALALAFCALGAWDEAVGALQDGAVVEFGTLTISQVAQLSKTMYLAGRELVRTPGHGWVATTPADNAMQGAA